MKRKRLDRDIWTTITSKRYIQRRVINESFDGIVSLLYLDEVSKASRWAYPDGYVAVCAAGMRWLQVMPAADHYLITAMMENGRINLWYIDIIAGQGLAEDGVAFYDDLYLDLVVRPGGDIRIDDMDELEEALAQRDITQVQYDMALETMERLRDGLLCDLPKLYDACIRAVHELEYAQDGQ